MLVTIVSKPIVKITCASLWLPDSLFHRSPGHEKMTRDWTTMVEIELSRFEIAICLDSIDFCHEEDDFQEIVNRLNESMTYLPWGADLVETVESPIFISTLFTREDFDRLCQAVCTYLYCDEDDEELGRVEIALITKLTEKTEEKKRAETRFSSDEASPI